MTPAERTDRMIGRIAREHGVTVAMIKGSRGSRATIWARLEVYGLLNRHGWSSVRIGRHIGGRDHTTILEGLRRLTDRARRRTGKALVCG